MGGTKVEADKAPHMGVNGEITLQVGIGRCATGRTHADKETKLSWSDRHVKFEWQKNRIRDNGLRLGMQ